jgi:Domain of unknown function (DUF4157)/Bacterial toxin 4
VAMGDSKAGYLSREPRQTIQAAPRPTRRNIFGGAQDRFDLQRTAGNQAVARLLAPSRVPASDLTSGKPLDSATRSRMESLLGADFSQVRVHPDAETPPRLARSDVPAFTLGHDVHLTEGGYLPHTPEGIWLLAHELAHVAQQTRSGDASLAASADAAEREARAAADAVGANKPFPVQSRTGVCLACAPAKPTSPPPAPTPAPAASLRIIREWAAPDGFVIDIEVGPGVARLGLEKTLPSGTEVGLAGWHRAHSSGAGVGAESGHAIRYAPPEVNLGYQNSGIERFIREFNQERASDVRLLLRTQTTTHPGSLRLASITYRLSAARGTGPASDLFEVTINIANSRDHPRVWVDEPIVGKDWTTFLGPRAGQIPKTKGVKPPSAKKTPPSSTPASAKAKLATGGPVSAGAESAGADIDAPKQAPPQKLLPPVAEPLKAPPAGGGGAEVEGVPLKVPPAGGGGAEIEGVPLKVPSAGGGGTEIEIPKVSAGKAGGFGTGMAAFQAVLLLLQLIPNPDEQQAIQRELAKALSDPRVQAQFSKFEPQVHAYPDLFYYVITFKINYSASQGWHWRASAFYSVRNVEILSIGIWPHKIESSGELDPPSKPRDLQMAPHMGGYYWEASRVVTISIRPVRP